MKGLIQVAGVTDLEEAQLLVEAGVDQIGFPLRLAVHREDLTEDEAARIVRSLESAVSFIVITYAAKAREILGLCRKLGVRSVQVHSDLAPEEARRLKAIDPELILIKSLIVRAGGNLSELESTVRALSPYADAFITDTYDPATGACGATGKPHDWAVSRRLVELSPRPVILAGGLTPENVRGAILQVRPAGVDVHTGVEDIEGRKDRDRVRAFVSEARIAFETV